MPIAFALGPRMFEVGVNPGSPKNGLAPGMAGSPAMIAGSLPVVISIGRLTSKIACENPETGDFANTIAQFTPTVDAARVWVPFPRKLPVTVLAEQGAAPAAGTLYCRVAENDRSVPSLFSTVSGSEILAATWPGASELVRVGSS